MFKSKMNFKSNSFRTGYICIEIKQYCISRQFPIIIRLGNSLLVLLGRTSSRQDLGTTFSQGWKSLYNTIVYMIKSDLMILYIGDIRNDLYEVLVTFEFLIFLVMFTFVRQIK